MARALPAPVDHFLVQADLTVVVPGPLERHLAEELSTVAADSVESAGSIRHGAQPSRANRRSGHRPRRSGRTAQTNRILPASQAFSNTCAARVDASYRRRRTAGTASRGLGWPRPSCDAKTRPVRPGRGRRRASPGAVAEFDRPLPTVCINLTSPMPGHLARETLHARRVTRSPRRPRRSAAGSSP